MPTLDTEVIQRELNADDVYAIVEAYFCSEKGPIVHPVRLFEDIMPKTSSWCIRKAMKDGLKRLRKDFPTNTFEQAPELGVETEGTSVEVSPQITTQVILYGLFIVQALESPYYVGTERWRHLMIPLVKEVECRLDPPGHAARMVLAWVKAKKVPAKSLQPTSRSAQAIGLVMAWMGRDGEQLNEGIGSTISRGGDNEDVHALLDEVHKQMRPSPKSYPRAHQLKPLQARQWAV